MNGPGRNNDSSRPIDSLDSFEHLEGIINGHSDEDFELDLPFDIHPPESRFDRDGFSQDDLEDPGHIFEERLTSESLGGDILHFDDERETSGLLNESELLNDGEQHYDSGSNCLSEDVFYKEGNPLGRASSMDQLQRYVEATPRPANASLQEPPGSFSPDYGDHDRSFGYSDDPFHPDESFHNSHDEQYSDVLPHAESDQNRNCRRNMSSGLIEEERSAGEESDDLSAGASTERNNTVVAAKGRLPRHQSAHEEKYEDDPPGSKDSDSASLSIGQFVPYAVNRNCLPRPMGKPVKRSTLKDERDLVRSHDSRQASVASRSARSSARTSPRLSAAGSLHRGRNSPRYSQRSNDPSDRSRNKQSSTNSLCSRSRSQARSPIVPRLELRRTSTASSANQSHASEPSKLELSLRLREESRTRQQADEVIEQLQKNYDELLGKHARAENTIDQLKLGARVNLYGDGPAPGQSIQGNLSPAHKPGTIVFTHPQKATVHHIVSPGSHISGGQTENQPPNGAGTTTMGMQTNNNNTVEPAGTRPSEVGRNGDCDGFPAGEGILMALAFQVKSLQEQIDSFGTLLRENQIAPSEQKTVLAQLRMAQGQLEADYMHAREEHNARRRRNTLLSAGAESTFDPDRSVEGEIFQLGMQLEDLAEIVQNNCNQPRGLENEEEELQRLREKLERELNKSRQDGDDHDGTARNPQSKVPTNMANGPRRPKQSQLPRPASLANKIPNHERRGSSDTRPTNGDNTKPINGDNTKRNQAPQQKSPERHILSPEADSGFMGSESSRQSNQNGGLPGYDSQLRKPRDRITLRSGKLPQGQRSPPPVSRKLTGNWESPGFSDYDISERDEEVDEASARSAGAGKKRTAASERTAPAKSTAQTRGRKNPAAVTQAPEKQRERLGMERHGLYPDGRTGTKYLKGPNTTRDAYRPYPKQSREAQRSQNGKPKGGIDPMRSRNKSPFGVSRRTLRMPPQRELDSESDATISSWKSEAIRDLQGEVGRLSHQMAKLSSRENPRRSPALEETHHRTPNPRSNHFDNTGSEASNGRSEILRALQYEIDDLRNQVERQAAPSPTYNPPVSRTSIKYPPKSDYQDTSYAGSPPVRDRLRETLRQTYIPETDLEEPLFRRTPMRSFLHPTIPYRSQSHNHVSQSSPPYIPGATSTPASPPRTFANLQYSGASPSQGVTASPLYTIRHDPCPLCSGSGVHTHGDYSHPADTAARQSIAASGPTQYSNPSQGHAPVGPSVPQNPSLFSNSGQQSTLYPQQLTSNQQTVQYPRPVFNSQPGSNLGLTQPQPVTSQAQQVFNQPQPAFNQPQPAFNQPQPAFNQPQPAFNQSQPALSQPQQVLSQPQPVLSQPQPVLSQPQQVLSQPQPVLIQPQSTLIPPMQTPVLNQGSNHPTSMQGSVPQVVLAQPVTCVPLLTYPVYSGVPVNATQRGTSEKQTKTKRERKRRTSKDSQKSASKPQAIDQSTTIYITPTKRKGRHYVLNDANIDSTGMEEFYFKRTPRVSNSGKHSSFIRRTTDSKYTQSSSFDLDKAIRMADKLNRSSHRMLETVRTDISQSQYL